MAELTEAQQRYKQFLDLLPLTIALAGLPQSEPTKPYNDDQLEARATQIKKAYKHARNIARVCIESQ
jgi:hypothetical protein